MTARRLLVGSEAVDIHAVTALAATLFSFLYHFRPVYLIQPRKRLSMGNIRQDHEKQS
jgi:hypothetical protein